MMATKKRTSDRVSRIAAKVMRRWSERSVFLRKSDGAPLTWGEALALAGSCLSQDEVKGKRPAKRRRKA